MKFKPRACWTTTSIVSLMLGIFLLLSVEPTFAEADAPLPLKEIMSFYFFSSFGKGFTVRSAVLAGIPDIAVYFNDDPALHAKNALAAFSIKEFLTIFREVTGININTAMLTRLSASATDTVGINPESTMKSGFWGRRS